MPAENRRPDSAVIEKATGATGAWNEEEGVFKVSVPRTDLSVTVAGVRLTPALGLTTWAAFQNAGDQTIVMGDLVLTEEQVGPIMDTALASGLEVTALHNHFFWDSPRVMFMHIGGMGEEARLAEAVGKVFAKIKEPSEKRPMPEAKIDPATTSLQPEKIASILGHKGQLKDGVYKVVIGRTTLMHGHKAGNAMGVNTWAAFAGSDNQAVVDGDFAVLGTELQAVLKALRTADIQVVAIHNHMVGEEPRIVFLHYWGVGAADRLAKGVRAALDKTT
ncbi:MAG: DUF1259 domain-containing protein [Thermoanaerobaculia bacterium]